MPGKGLILKLLQPQSFPLPLNDDEFINITRLTQDVIDDEKYPRKYRSNNFYKKLSPELIHIVENLLKPFLNTQNLKWHFEIFFSQDPVGWHNDRNYFPEINERCDMGMLIPLSWTGKSPITKFYDLSFEEKVNWDGRGFSTLDKKSLAFSEEKLKTSKDLVWEKKKIIFFDSRQIHKASNFMESKSDYKLSLNGLGYSPYL